MTLIIAADIASKSTPLHPKEAISYRKLPQLDTLQCSYHIKIKLLGKGKEYKYYTGLRQGDRPLKRAPLSKLASANKRLKSRHITNNMITSLSHGKGPKARGHPRA